MSQPDETIQKSELICPTCLGQLEIGKISFSTTDGVDFVWLNGGASEPPGGIKGFFGIGASKYETIPGPGWFGDGERIGYRCRECQLLLFRYFKD